jgi:predicted Zn-dependent peptidase
VLAERGPDALKLLADVAQRPRLPEADLGRIKANLARNLAIQKARRSRSAEERFAALIYGDHPYGRLSSRPMRCWRGYTVDDVRRFHKDHFGPRRARLYIAGVFDAGRHGESGSRRVRDLDGCRSRRHRLCRRLARAHSS